jgi:hypothetical protein
MSEAIFLLEPVLLAHNLVLIPKRIIEASLYLISQILIENDIIIAPTTIMSLNMAARLQILFYPFFKAILANILIRTGTQPQEVSNIMYGAIAESSLVVLPFGKTMLEFLFAQARNDVNVCHIVIIVKLTANITLGVTILVAIRTNYHTIDLM